MVTDVQQYCYECPICIENLGTSKKVMSTPCHHFIHEACYEDYKRYNIKRRMEVNCPICRTELIPQPASPIHTIIDIYDHHTVHDRGTENENHVLQHNIMMMTRAFMVLGVLLWCAIIFANLNMHS